MWNSINPLITLEYATPMSLAQKGVSANNRKQFLDFANWAKIGDDRLKSLTPVSDSDPVAEGSKVIGEFGGIKTVVVITVCSPSLLLKPEMKED